MNNSHFQNILFSGLLLTVACTSLAMVVLVSRPEPKLELFKGYFVSDEETHGFYPCDEEKIYGYSFHRVPEFYPMYNRLTPGTNSQVYVQLTGVLVDFDEPVYNHWNRTYTYKYVDIYEFSNMKPNYRLMCGEEQHYMAERPVVVI